MINKHLLLILTIILLLLTSTINLTAIQINPETNHKFNRLQPLVIQNLGNILYVDDDNTNGPWDGTINHPYQYIQDAIQAAQSHDHIYVFNGTYYENLHIKKTLTLEGESNQHTIIDGNYISNVISITAPNVTLARFTIQNSGITQPDAALLITKQHTIIIENNIYHNNHGILINTPNNAIIYNNFEDNKNHAYTQMNNTITYNYWDNTNKNDQNEDGICDIPYQIPGDNITDPFPLIHRYGSITNKNTQNIFFNIQSAIDDVTTQPYHIIKLKPDIYHEHLIIKKPLIIQGTSPSTTIIDGSHQNTTIYLQTNDTTITQLTIQNSGTNQIDTGIQITGHNNTITKNRIIENYIGIKLSHAQNTILTHNQITHNNWVGLIINHHSHKTLIHDNSFQSNLYAGIGINTSHDNKIYHNDFINHQHHAYDDSYNTWDNDLPTGGNYWDDYTGNDTDYNFIGDDPYPIKGGINQDRYPLMYPQHQYDTTPPTIKITKPTNGLYIRERHILSRLLQKTIIIGKITINAKANDAESGIIHVKFYLNNQPYPEKTDNQPPFEWRWENGEFPPDIHQIKVVAYNGAGLESFDKIEVKRYL